MGYSNIVFYSLIAGLIIGVMLSTWWQYVHNTAIRKAAVVASRFSIDHRLHPDIANEDLNEAARTACHSTSQQIALLIMELKI